MVVFPACAGMFLHLAAGCKTPTRFPRVRGDVPLRVRRDHIEEKFSPRARGCSASVCFAGAEAGVFPACAGMFRLWQCTGIFFPRFPRVRGDVPKSSLSRLLD